MQNVFITGSTGYIGTRLIKSLLNETTFHIQALARKGSENKLPGECEIISGDALNAESYQDKINPSSIFIHLVGVAHPSPSKKEQFNKIDLVSIQEAVKAAVHAGIIHFIYLSVSMYPTKFMKDFQEVRAQGEQLLLQTNLKTSFIRPWYVLGPGHWWPLLLKPFLSIAKLFPSKREAVKYLDTVTIKQMIITLVFAIKNPPLKNTVYDVPKIKSFEGLRRSALGRKFF